MPTEMNYTKLKGTKIDTSDWYSKSYAQFLNQYGNSFSINELTDDLELNGKLMSELDEAVIYTLIDDTLNKPVSHQNLMNYIKSIARKNSYHPIKRYFESLPQNNVSGEIDKLLKHFSTNNDDLFEIYLKKFLVGSVAKVYEGVQNPMLVLDGKQGIGKSHFVQWLNPDKKHFYSGPIKPNDKDNLSRLITNFLWEVSELGSTIRKADYEALKHFITIDGQVKVRLSYGKRDIVKPPMSNFIGTINNVSGFLNDPTGSRRFNIITVNELDWNYQNSLTADLIWAEAYHLYRTGNDFKLTQEESKLRDEHNSSYIDKNHTDEVLDSWITISEDSSDFILSVNLTNFVKQKGIKGKDNKIQKDIAKWMKRNGIDKKRISKCNNQSGYVGIRLSNQQG